MAEFSWLPKFQELSISLLRLSQKKPDKNAIHEEGTCIMYEIPVHERLMISIKT
jgi:hypothetical protein